MIRDFCASVTFLVPENPGLLNYNCCAPGEEGGAELSCEGEKQDNNASSVAMSSVLGSSPAHGDT